MFRHFLPGEGSFKMEMRDFCPLMLYLMTLCSGWVAIYLLYSTLVVFPWWKSAFKPREREITCSNRPNKQWTTPPGLRMDYKYLTFLEYLWVSTFVTPGAVALALCGALSLLIRKIFMSETKAKCNPCSVTASIILETTMVIYFDSLCKKTNTATFIFRDICYVDDETGRPDPEASHTLIVRLDLNLREMKDASLDSKTLRAAEAMVLTVYVMMSLNHVRLHAFSNGGTDLSKKASQYHRTTSIVTTAYNYFGYRAFPSFFPFWKALGLISSRWDTDPTDLFDSAVAAGIPQHGAKLGLLSQYSRFVSFTMRVRSVFLRQFHTHKDRFQDCDAEALFAGTVLHSLDHAMLKKCIPDPTWMTSFNDEMSNFSLLGEYTCLVLACFNDDIPGIYFNHRFKGSRHPFYEAVYDRAAVFDKELADCMDTCIIK